MHTIQNKGIQCVTRHACENCAYHMKHMRIKWIKGNTNRKMSYNVKQGDTKRNKSMQCELKGYSANQGHTKWKTSIEIKSSRVDNPKQGHAQQNKNR